MADDQKMPETLETIGERIEALAKSVDERFTKVDERFDTMQKDIDEAFVEQRKYTEFAFGRLDAKIDGKIDGLRAEMARGFNRLDRKLDVLLAVPRKRSSRRRRRT